MKSKQFLLILLTVGALTSCVSEDLADYASGSRNQTEGLPSTLSIRFNSGQVDTKATIGIEDYTYASPEELYVDKCAIAIFDIDENGPGVLKAYKYVIRGDEDFTTGYTQFTEPNDTAAYIVSDIPITTGMAHIVAIANLDENDTEAAIPHQTGVTTYADFMAMVKTTNFDNSFDPSHLIKVGEKTVNLQADNKVIEMPLTQLAARVDFTLTVAFPVQDLPIKVKYPTDTENILNLFSKNLQKYSHNKMPNVANEKEVQHVPYKGTKYYAFNCAINNTPAHYPDATTYINPFYGVINNSNIKYIESISGLTSSNQKVIEVGPVDPTAPNGIGIDSIFSKARWAFYIETTTVNNIQTKTDVVIQDYNTQVLHKGQWLNNYRDTVFDTYSITFYTYETFKTSDDLTIRIDGKLISGIEKTTKHYNATLHGVWVCGANSSGGYPGQAHGGWGSDNDVFATMVVEGNLAGIETDFDTSEQIEFDRCYQLKVNTTDILHGNLYHLTTTMDDSYLPALTKAGVTYSPAIAASRPVTAEDFLHQAYTVTPWGK